MATGRPPAEPGPAPPAADDEPPCPPDRPVDDRVEAARRLLREAMARPDSVPVSIRSRRRDPDGES